ncbi:MAG: hypothetical protein E7632_08985 [Ruminococcaceae bacterium]|nr:hypothetical protein [Oscillospiraceae bacterium]
MDDMTREEYGKMLLEIWRDVFIGILVCIGIVFAIFQSSRISHEREIKRQEIKAREAALAVSTNITAWAHINKPEYYEGRFLAEYRELEKLAPGEEYIVGQLRRFDRNRLTGFVNVMPDPDDDAIFHNPALTFHYRNYLHIETSLDDSWLVVGPTATAGKLKEYTYLPDATDDPMAAEGWGKGMTSVYIPVNGRDNVAVTDGEYNYCITEKFSDLYTDAAGNAPDWTRKVWVSHIFVTAYNQNPLDKKSQNPEPVAALTLRVKYYEQWDVSEEEFKKYQISDYNFTSHVTVEIVK